MHIKEERRKRKEQRLVSSERKDSAKKQHSSRLVFFCLSSFFFLLFSLKGNAQCAMCRAALEGEGNASKAEAVNDGIVYLMAIPYILVAVIGYYIYRTQIGKKKS